MLNNYENIGQNDKKAIFLAFLFKTICPSLKQANKKWHTLYHNKLMCKEKLNLPVCRYPFHNHS